MKTIPLCTAMALCGSFCTTLAWAEPFMPPFYHSSPPVMTAPLRREAAACPGEDQAFARDAEYLIAQGIAAARAQFAAAAPALQPDPDLTAIAQGRSYEMALGERPFSHDDAQGNFIAASRVNEIFGPYGAIGENIMEMGGSRTIDARQFARIAVDGWMKSPGHRANILDPSYNESGIGVALVGGQAFATQVFFGPPHHRARNP